VRKTIINWLLDHVPEGMPRPQVRLARRLHLSGRPILGAYSRYVELAVGEIRDLAAKAEVPAADLLLQVFFHEYHHFLGHYVQQHTPKELVLSTREQEQFAESYSRLMMERLGKGASFVSRPDLRYLQPGEIRMRWRTQL